MNLSILYRGPLSSCNYDCWYCPFAKRQESAAELADDRRFLERFVAWAEDHPALQLGILFTPWGEALVRRWYQEALARLTALPHVRRAAIQTNLSCPLDWIEECDKDRLALWTTYHPGEVERGRFVAKCRATRPARRALQRRGRRAQGARRGDRRIAPRAAGPHLSVDQRLQRSARLLRRRRCRRLTAIDPYFPINNVRHASLGKACRAGESVISVDGAGVIRRCHFIKTPLGNLYEDDLDTILRSRPCSNDTCGCHIGYVHLHELNLYAIFGDGVLERIPES